MNTLQVELEYDQLNNEWLLSLIDVDENDALLCDKAFPHKPEAEEVVYWINNNVTLKTPLNVPTNDVL